jgi:hypothetical protein
MKEYPLLLAARIISNSYLAEKKYQIDTCPTPAPSKCCTDTNSAWIPVEIPAFALIRILAVKHVLPFK